MRDRPEPAWADAASSAKTSKRQRHLLKRAGWQLLIALVGLALITTLILAVVHLRMIAPPRYYFGDLVTMPEHAQYESSQGVKVAMLELGWNAYEPEEGQFDARYVEAAKAKLDTFLAAGMKVTLGLGLQYPPGWVFNYSNSQFVNQNGAQANEVNLVFNQNLRQHAVSYFERINRDLGIQNFWAIRLTSGGDSEALYPQDGDYWAFDANAQNGPDMPPSMERNPFPGWKPGERTYNGQAFTTTQVGQWADWYIKALDDTINWQINSFNDLGFHGYYQVLTPGVGALPSDYAHDINNYLPNSITGIGAVWQKFYEFLPNKQRVVAYVSSMADNSGGNDSCQPLDDKVPLTSPVIKSWSAARWISRIADQYHLPKSGENPGYPTSDSFARYYANMSSTGLMANAIRQMQSCRFQGMYWAHDEKLWDGTLPFSLYARYITHLNGGSSFRIPIPNIPLLFLASLPDGALPRVKRA